jgi:hypothetical protein
MEHLLRYSPSLDDLLYLTSEEDFSENIKGREELVILIALKEIDSVAPVLSVPERELLLTRLIDNPIIRYIPSFNVLNLQLDLPEEIDIFEELKEIKVDEMNLTQILMMIKEGKAPNLQELSLIVSRPIAISTTHLKHLRSLTLKNTSSSIHSLPNLSNLSLDSLDLTGYAIEFEDTLPHTLKLQNCYVKNSCNIPGCKSMKLINSIWNSETTPGSLPSDALTIEDGTLTTRLPGTIKRLILVNTEVSFPLPDSLTSLHYDDRRQDITERQSIDTRNLFLKTLVVTLYESEIHIPSTVESLSVMKTMPSDLPGGLVFLELNNLVVDQVKFFSQLPVLLSKIRLIECSFTSSNDIIIPETLRQLEFIACQDNYHVGIDVLDTTDTLLVIGPSPLIRPRRLSPGSSARYLQAKTNTLLMNLREFHLFCISQLGRLSFAGFEDCYTDIVMGNKWRTPEELRKYTDIMYMYPFQIPNIRSQLVSKNILLYANPGATIKIGTTNHNVGNIRRLADSGTTRSTDPNLQVLIDLLKKDSTE